MARPRHERLTGRATSLQRLADDSHTAKVRAELNRCWTDGRQPAQILLRHGLAARSQADDPAPLAVRLIRSHGIALRLLLIMIFEAQCRLATGHVATSVRSVVPIADDPRPSWLALMASNVNVTAATGRGALQLRHRQLKEGLSLLNSAGTVELDRDPAGRLLYNDFRLLEEAGRAVAPQYVVPASGLYVDRRLFTEMWIFALSDAELATYLALCELRSRFPSTHDTHGIFAVEAERVAVLGLTRDVYESHILLRQCGLLHRYLDMWRHDDGKVVSFRKRTTPLKPHRFSVLDDGLAKDAFGTLVPLLRKEATLAAHEAAGRAAAKAAVAAATEAAPAGGSSEAASA